MSMPQIQKMHSIREVADILGVHYMTARKWCLEGKIKAQKIGRLWRVADDELKRVMDEGLDEGEPGQK